MPWRGPLTCWGLAGDRERALVAQGKSTSLLKKVSAVRICPGAPMKTVLSRGFPQHPWSSTLPRLAAKGPFQGTLVARTWHGAPADGVRDGLVAGRPGRRGMGRARRLPSRRWQARYLGPDMTYYSGPTTFRTRGGHCPATASRADPASPVPRRTRISTQVRRWFRATAPGLSGTSRGVTRSRCAAVSTRAGSSPWSCP